MDDRTDERAYHAQDDTLPQPPVDIDEDQQDARYALVGAGNLTARAFAYLSLEAGEYAGLSRGGLARLRALLDEEGCL